MEKYTRVPIKHGTKIMLTFDKDKQSEFVIDGVVGYGGSSIVYKARDSRGISVILKEFYPEQLKSHISRTETGELTTSKYDRFIFLKERFRNGYQNHLKIFEISPNNTTYPF